MHFYIQRLQFAQIAVGFRVFDLLFYFIRLFHKFEIIVAVILDNGGILADIAHDGGIAHHPPQRPVRLDNASFKLAYIACRKSVRKERRRDDCKYRNGDQQRARNAELNAPLYRLFLYVGRIFFGAFCLDGGFIIFVCRALNFFVVLNDKLRSGGRTLLTEQIFGYCVIAFCNGVCRHQQRRARDYSENIRNQIPAQQYAEYQSEHY